ncbi:hypothetical protein BDV29DRAFT_186892 [Aspergillus leporis]|uniref:Uncharacterized protein n=1 Tax=Aspergillus leporis TaxID=41062 RepID=A0A5N5WHQ2_9EURO|nr:hypothetical protein BDV29DRAFT_186892 [Aspergillus leporis]
MRTNGYRAGYIENSSAPGGVKFESTGFSVKSCESEYHFMVFAPKPAFTAPCTRDDMVEWARRWSGYEVLDDEKEYYMDLTRTAESGEGLKV